VIEGDLGGDDKDLGEAEQGLADGSPLDGDKSFRIFVEPLKSKTAKAIIAALNEISMKVRQGGGAIRQLYGDNGMILPEVSSWARSNNILPDFSAPYSPASNGRAERCVGLAKEGGRRLACRRGCELYTVQAMVHWSNLMTLKKKEREKVPTFGDPVVYPHTAGGSRCSHATYLGLMDTTRRRHLVVNPDGKVKVVEVAKTVSPLNEEETKWLEREGFEVVSLANRPALLYNKRVLVGLPRVTLIDVDPAMYMAEKGKDEDASKHVDDLDANPPNKTSDDDLDANPNANHSDGDADTKTPDKDNADDKGVRIEGEKCRRCTSGAHVPHTRTGSCVFAGIPLRKDPEVACGACRGRRVGHTWGPGCLLKDREVGRPLSATKQKKANRAMQARRSVALSAIKELVESRIYSAQEVEQATGLLKAMLTAGAEAEIGNLISTGCLAPMTSEAARSQNLELLPSVLVWQIKGSDNQRGKLRWTCAGNFQKTPIHDQAAKTCNPDSVLIRLVLLLAQLYDWDVSFLDVTTAFLRSELRPLESRQLGLRIPISIHAT
jgi:hypothetical protein